MNQNRFLLSTAVAAFCGAGFASATVVITDTFETNSASNYTVVNDGSPNGTQTFAWDYTATGIPLAPRSAPGEGKGLRLTANDSAAAVDAWTIFHNTPVTAQQYRLEVDVWMNFAVAAASTEHAQVGVGGSATTFNSVFTPISGSGAFIAFTGDGGSASDYRWYRAAANSFADDPATAPTVPSTTLSNTHPSYLGNGSNNAGAFYTSLFPLGSRPAPAVAGSPGNMWTTLAIDVDNDAKLIRFSFDGTKTFEGTFVGDFKGLASLGINDTFTSVDAGSVFTLYDNLTVTVVPEPGVSALALLGCMAVMRRRR